MSLTTNRNHPDINKPRGKNQQNEAYLILSEEERSKGFIRPVRNRYVHIGRFIKFEEGIIRELSEEEKERYNKHDKTYSHYIDYPEYKSPLVGRLMTQEDIDNVGKHIGGCGNKTLIVREIAETYARDPKYYGTTWCTTCRAHFPVNEFIWDDGNNEEVGT